VSGEAEGRDGGGVREKGEGSRKLRRRCELVRREDRGGWDGEDGEGLGGKNGLLKDL